MLSFCHSENIISNGETCFERHFDGDDHKIATLAPFIDCHDPGRTVSWEPNIHSGLFNNAEQFSIDVSFKNVQQYSKNRRVAEIQIFEKNLPHRRKG